MFNPETCQCPKCETVLRSKYPGHFMSCECGDSFVDQTSYYSRYGGSVQSLEDLIHEDFLRIYFSDVLQEFLDKNLDLE